MFVWAELFERHMHNTHAHVRGTACSLRCIMCGHTLGQQQLWCVRSYVSVGSELYERRVYVPHANVYSATNDVWRVVH
jgi:hypothetical protein